MDAETAAAQFPVVRFEVQVLEGEFSLWLGEGEPSVDASSDLAVNHAGSWQVSPQASATYKAGEWNEVSVGFDSGTCAVQVNGRTERVTGTGDGNNGQRLFFVAHGETAKVQVRKIYRLSDARRP